MENSNIDSFKSIRLFFSHYNNNIMKFTFKIDSFNLYQQALYSPFKYDVIFFLPQKPLIGFEPMTYALPWRYSTAELKGPFLLFI